MCPNPRNFEAKWVKRVSKSGSRKPSTNLWIYDRKTGAKRYSVTTEAGAKIQPYFDVPPLTDPNVFIFTVIGEALDAGFVRVWLTDATTTRTKTPNRLVGPGDIKPTVIEASQKVAKSDIVEEAQKEIAHPFSITVEAYEALEGAFAGVSDEHRFQLLAEQIRGGDAVSLL